MKIFVTSDTHGQFEGLEEKFQDCDVICFAGDIAPTKGFGKWHVYDQKKWTVKKFNVWAQKYPEKHFVFTPGNHDFFPIGQQMFGNIGHDWNCDFATNVHMLIDREVVIDGIRFYGSPWVPIISYRWAFEAEHDVLHEKFSKIPEKVDVLLTHSPPHLSTEEPIDRSLQNGGYEAFGSNELTQAIYAKSPRYAFCGHIHSGLHDRIVVGSTECYNVSRVDERYEIAYEPVIINIDHQV